MMTALKILEVEIILMSYYLVFVIFDLLKKYFGEKFWKYMQLASIIIPKQRAQYK